MKTAVLKLSDRKQFYGEKLLFRLLSSSEYLLRYERVVTESMRHILDVINTGYRQLNKAVYQIMLCITVKFLLDTGHMIFDFLSLILNCVFKAKDSFRCISTLITTINAESYEVLL